MDSNPCNAADAILSDYIDHPSLQKIREDFNITVRFFPTKFSTQEFQNEILTLDPKRKHPWKMIYLQKISIEVSSQYPC